MEIHGLVAIGVDNVHHVAVAAFASGENHAPAADGLHGRAYRSAIVRSEVRAVNLQDGMEAGFAEMRSDWRAKLQWRLQERLLKGFAIGGVVRRLAVGIVKQKRFVVAAAILVL